MLESTKNAGETARRAPSPRGWYAAVLIAPACFFLGMAVASSRPLLAQNSTADVPRIFLKFGKTSINLQRISHIIDEPGFNLPQNTVQVFFTGSQSWVNLFDAEADAFRQSIAPMTTELVAPAAKGAAGDAKKAPAKKAPPKKAAAPVDTDPNG